MTDRTTSLTDLNRSWAVLLTTFKRDGSSVGTPVNLAFDGERAYFRTYDKTWKTRRLARDPRVELAPAGIRGKPKGPALSGQARLLSGTDEAEARLALRKRHPLFQGRLIPLVHRLAHYRTMHYEVSFTRVTG